jgi:hypothetical protein
MWRYTAFLTIVLFTACPGAVRVPAGSPPQIVMVQLASKMEFTPFSPEQLANPHIQSVIAQCERGGNENCRGINAPANVQTTFVQGVDEKVFVAVVLHRLETNREHRVRYRLLDPKGNLHSRFSIPSYIPAGFPPDESLTFFAHLDVSKLSVGHWQVEIAVNDQVVEMLPFDVVGEK